MVALRLCLDRILPPRRERRLHFKLPDLHSASDAATTMLVIGLLLSACFEEPKLQADTEPNFDASYAILTKDLSSADKEKLDGALKDIVLVEVGIYGPTREAKSFRLPSNEPGVALGQVFAGRLDEGTSPLMDLALSASWDRGRAKLVVENARTLVDGRSAKEILAIADTERKKAIEVALAIYRDQLAKANSALNDVRAEAVAAEQKLAEQKILLQQVVITNARFTFVKTRFLDQPAISFTIANKGTIPIKRIFVHGKVQTPGRAIPWVDADFNYSFPGGLEPNETKALNLSPNMFSDWGKVPKEAVKGSILDLTLTSFEDAAEKSYGDDAAKHQSFDLRKKALEDGIQTLQHKINELERTQQGGG